MLRLKKSISLLLCVMLVVTASVFIMDGTPSYASEETRGIWLSFTDYSDLGLKDKTESEFTASLDTFLDRAAYYGVNTVYFHARAFDDAAWKSETFKASRYLDSDASANKTAADTYSYDPLTIVIRECHERSMSIEAWLNPYRITYSRFLDPQAQSSTDRINRAVDELQNYDLDGIHFDDYYYHSKDSYRTPSEDSKYAVSVTGTDTSSRPSAANRRTYVNAMVASVYANVHEKTGMKFGISPAGNVDNCMSAGADVKTWLSSPGYVDYLAPQIYWTDNWGSSGTTAMFTNRLTQWTSLDLNGTPMYAGLALYRAGISSSDDRGWGWSSTNLRTQVSKARAMNCQGYILFTAKDIFRSSAATELYKLKGLVDPVTAASISFKYNRRAWVGKSVATSLTWNPSDTNPKSVKYSSSNTAVATVSSNGRVTGMKPGRVRITATTSNGKTAVMTKVVKTARVKVIRSRITSRKGPGSRYRKSSRYKRGKILYINRCRGNWGKIRFTNKWVYLPNTSLY